MRVLVKYLAKQQKHTKMTCLWCRRCGLHTHGILLSAEAHHLSMCSSFSQWNLNIGVLFIDDIVRLKRFHYKSLFSVTVRVVIISSQACNASSLHYARVTHLLLLLPLLLLLSNIINIIIIIIASVRIIRCRRGKTTRQKHVQPLLLRVTLSYNVHERCKQVIKTKSEDRVVID